MKTTVHSTNENEYDPHYGEVMNVDEALQRLGDDVELLRDIVQIYLEDAPAIVERIHTAISQSDANSLQRAAHSLKGLAATLSAAEVVGVAAKLEHLAATRDMSDASKSIAEVDERLDELNRAVQVFLRRK